VDHLALIALAGELARELPGTRIADFRQETEHRFRLVVVDGERGRAHTVSLRPESPWIGRVPARRSDARRRTTSFAAEVRRAIHDRVIARVVRTAGTRALRIDTVDGPSLVAELSPHAANLVLVDADGSVRVAARHPPSSRDRLASGASYRPPIAPEGLADPLEGDPDGLDVAVAERVAGGLDRVRALRSSVIGLTEESARRLVDDAVRRRVGVGAALRWRAERLLGGLDRPILERREGDDGPGTLIPWAPEGAPASSASRTEGRSVADTLGHYHDDIERRAWEGERRDGLIAILKREIRRLERTERRVRADAAAFEDPEAARRAGEAILAGLHVAERAGEFVRVPDPYSPDGARLEVLIDPAIPLTRAADALFARHRRAVRGLRATEERRDTIRARLDRLIALEASAAVGAETGALSIEALERSMRDAGIAVGLDEVRRVRLAAVAAGARPRIEGVRMYSSDADVAILVGKTARDNHHLTFRIAQPEDFWFHALGCAGAHVVARNPERRARPDPETLLLAAAAAAWFSEARSQARVDVQWTRRKYVRKVRGGPPGAVLVKRSETVRVAPAAPGAEGGRHEDSEF